MAKQIGTLSFFCGKMAAGKSTRAKQIAEQCQAVLISEDLWLEKLYPAQVRCLSSYIEYSTRLKPIVKELVQSILTTGNDVVLDFPANTVNQRNWFRSIFAEIAAPHQLFYLARSDQHCLDQLAARRKAQPERVETDTEDMFWKMHSFFEEPSLEESFSLLVDGRS